MIRVLIADDHTIVREGVKLILEQEPDIQVVGQAQNGLEAVRQAEELAPDVVLMDVMMPGLDGIEACRRIAAARPNVKVLILSQVDTVDYLVKLLEHGAVGYVLKDSAIRELSQAIHTAMNGHVYLTPRMTSCFVQNSLKQPDHAAARLSRLSPREQEVLKYISDGLTNNQIADALNLSVKTVQAHRTNLMEKLDLHRRVDLVKYAIKSGLISVDAPDSPRSS